MISDFVGLASKAIDKIFPNQDDKIAAEREFAYQMFKSEQKKTDAFAANAEAQSKNWQADAKGQSFIQRICRPTGILIIFGIIGNKYLIAPYLQAFGFAVTVPDVPQEAWWFALGVCGIFYHGRSKEKIHGRQYN